MLIKSESILSTDGKRGVRGRPASSLLDEVGRLWTKVSGGLPASAVTRLRIGVCSTFTGEGATSVAANFAIFLAQHGRRAALVEANLRSSKLADHFGLRRSPGLWELMEGTAATEEIARCVAPNLDLIGGGGAPADFAAEFDGRKLDRVLQLLERDHDVAVVDSPPLSVAPEAGQVLRGLDSVVLVVRANRTRKVDVRRSVRTIHEFGLPLAGVVLNDLRYEVPAFLAALL